MELAPHIRHFRYTKGYIVNAQLLANCRFQLSSNYYGFAVIGLHPLLRLLRRSCPTHQIVEYLQFLQ